MKNRTIAIAAVGLSIGLFIAALTQKAFCTTGSCVDSLAVLIFGVFVAVFGHGAGLSWLANPLLLFSWIVVQKNRASLILCSISTALALSFLLFDEVMVDEAGHFREIIEYEPGYWLWVGSHAVMLIGNLVLRSRSGTGAVASNERPTELDAGADGS